MEEEYLILNLDSRDLYYEGSTGTWNVTHGDYFGFKETIPNVTSVELIESFIPDTYFNINEENNEMEVGIHIETHTYGHQSDAILTGIALYPNDYTFTHELTDLATRQFLTTTIVADVFNFSEQNGYYYYIQVYAGDDTTPFFSGNLLEINEMKIERSVDDITQYYIGEKNVTQGVDDLVPIIFKVFLVISIELPERNYLGDNFVEYVNTYIWNYIFNIDSLVYERLYLYIQFKNVENANKIQVRSLKNIDFYVRVNSELMKILGFTNTLIFSGLKKDYVYRQQFPDDDEILIYEKTNEDGFVTEVMYLNFELTVDTTIRYIYENENLDFDIHFVKKITTINNLEYKIDVEIDVDGSKMVFIALNKSFDINKIATHETYKNIMYKKKFNNHLYQKVDNSQYTNPISYMINLKNLNNVFNNVPDDIYYLKNATIIDFIDYGLDIQFLESNNRYNFSGERYVDMNCVQVSDVLKRQNDNMVSMYRYYFDDVSNTYTLSSKGNVFDLILKNPRDFPKTNFRLFQLRFTRRNGRFYDFKGLPFFASFAIKYYKSKMKDFYIE